MKGAKATTARKSAMMVMPMMASGLRASRRRQRGAWRRSALASLTAGVVSVIADPRVDKAVDQVHQQVDDDERDGYKQHGALHHGVVAREHRGDQHAAHPGPGEDRLGDDGARQQRAELEAAHREDG